MKNNNNLYFKLNVILLILVNLCFVNISFAFPYQFRRIIFYEGKNIIKTIDLISDYHREVTQLVKRPSRTRKKYLKAGEESAFMSTERSLLITLRKLANKKEPIEILWEIIRGLLSGQMYVPASAKTTGKYIRYGQILSEQFKNTSIIFQNADTYRFNEIGMPNPRLLTNQTIPSEYESLLLRNLTAFIPQLLDPKTSKAYKDLKAVKNTKLFGKDYYDSLYNYWTKFVQENVQPIADYFEQFLKQNPDMTFGEFREQIGTLPEEISLKILDIADAEFIIKSFATDIPHTIIYAGGDHCDTVERLLREFGGEKIIEIGIDGLLLKSAWKQTLLYVFLSPDAWTYLEEDPQKSLMRYKHNNKKPLVNNANQVIHEFDKLYEEIKDLPDVSNVLRPELDKEITQKITIFHKKSSKTYIDFVNGIDKTGKTLIFYTIMKNLPEATACLIKHGARVQVKDNDGNTPLNLAINTDANIVLELINNGADVNEKDNAGDTLLHLAVGSQADEVVQILINNGANINAKNNAGDTPLHWAQTKQIAQALIEKGADVNAKNNTGDTPLHLAVGSQVDEVVQILINNGANINERNNDGDTPLHWAARNHADEVVQMLIEKGADINAKNNAGLTPLEVAVENE